MKTALVVLSTFLAAPVFAAELLQAVCSGETLNGRKVSAEFCLPSKGARGLVSCATGAPRFIEITLRSLEADGSESWRVLPVRFSRVELKNGDRLTIQASDLQSPARQNERGILVEAAPTGASRMDIRIEGPWKGRFENAVCVFDRVLNSP